MRRGSQKTTRSSSGPVTAACSWCATTSWASDRSSVASFRIGSGWFMVSRDQSRNWVTRLVSCRARACARSDMRRTSSGGISPPASSSRVEVITASGVCMSWLTPASRVLRTWLAAASARDPTRFSVVRHRASSSAEVNGLTT